MPDYPVIAYRLPTVNRVSGTMVWSSIAPSESFAK